MINSELKSDKRQHPRVATVTDFSLLIDGKRYVGKTSNLSENGAFLVVPQSSLSPSNVSQSGDLDIMLDGEWAHFKCDIVYVGTDGSDSAKFGAGVQRYDIEKEKWDKKSAAVMNKRTDWRIHRNYQTTFKTSNVLRPVYEFFSDMDKDKSHVLDYGCGEGWAALLLYTQAKKVTAFDISQGRIDVLNKYIEVNNINNIEALATDGENLPFENEVFDYVFGNAILHHLILDSSLKEVARTLKTGGKAAFCEPFAHNPLINLYRYIHHHYFEDHVGTDEPLIYQDKAIFEKYFSHVEFRESSFFRDRWPLLIPLDRWLLKIPFLRPYVCYISILLIK